ncbi:MAG: hypothetical protein WCG25_04575 [bacterium]
MDTTEKIVLESMIFLLIIIGFVLYLSIKKYRKNNENYKKLKVETEISQLTLLLFQYQLRIVCEFLPDLEQTNYFEKGKSPDGS